jgi:hypothetical protein
VPVLMAGVQPALALPIALPHTVTGAVIGVSARLPGVAAASEPPVEPVPPQVAVPLPNRPAELPQTVTGALTGAPTPPALSREPEPPLEPVPAVPLPPDPDEVVEPPLVEPLGAGQDALARPRIAMALPQTVTETCAGARTGDRRLGAAL